MELGHNFTSLQLISSSTFGEHRDCGVKAVAVSCNVPYEKAHEVMSQAGRKYRGSSYDHMYHTAAYLLGKTLVPYKVEGKTVRTLERNIPKKGGFLVIVRGHSLGVYNGKVIDWTEGRCHRIRRVYKVEDIS